MVDSATSFSRSGLRDWIIQRVSAVIMAVYVVILFWAVFSVDDHDYAFWHALYQHTAMRVLSLLVVLSLVCHAWIGMWTVYTDYIKSTALRLVLQVATVVGLITLLIWSVVIFWG